MAAKNRARKNIAIEKTATTNTDNKKITALGKSLKKRKKASMLSGGGIGGNLKEI